MDITNVAPAGSEGASAPVVAPTPASDTLTAREAHQAYTARRDRESKAPETAPAKAAPVEQELAETPSSDPPEEAPAETTETTEPDESPPIEPPRSWTKEAKERWESLPRETQEYLAGREQEREREFRRSQNEAAEKLKGLSAKEQAVEQARQQYEKALPAVLQLMQEQQQGEFSDIKSMADVEKLAREDWPRYALWDAQQKKIAAIQNEARSAQERQQSEYQAQWSSFAEKQDKLAADLIPDLADKAKSKALGEAVLATVESVGFTKEEFGKAWIGEASISPRDARWQQILEKAARYDQAKAAPPKAAPKTVPQVQKPGVAQPKGAGADAAVQALRNKLSSGGNVNDAFALYQAKKKAAAS